MANPTGFLTIDYQDSTSQSVSRRVRNFKEFVQLPEDKVLRQQGERCMDCGIPYCHQGCPVNNIIPDWNDLVYRDQWRQAHDLLHATNNFPEMTGRICPAPCEAACTLNLIDQPVTIKNIERAIADRGRQEGWTTPKPAKVKTGHSIAVVGSGPAGLSCAQQLARIGHRVEVYEKNDRLGGLLRYGIPDFKMEKNLIDFRIQQMEAEGVIFHTGCHIGIDITMTALAEKHQAIVLAGGAEHPRDLPLKGRDLQGVHFAMDYLTQQNRRAYGEQPKVDTIITAKNKHVVVIGGGDTGSDCIGTANRQGATCITQLEILDKPPLKEDKGVNWPHWPTKLRTSSSHIEGCVRDWSVSTTQFLGHDGQITQLSLTKIDWQQKADGTMSITPKGDNFQIQADLVLLAMGFVHPVYQGMIENTGLELDRRGNVQTDADYQTSKPGIFAIGDMRRGQSLVVWAIHEGRQAAKTVDRFLGK